MFYRKITVFATGPWYKYIIKSETQTEWSEKHMSAKVWNEAFCTTTVCINSYEDGILQGHFFNRFLPEGRSFNSTIQFLLEMEQMLDEMAFPQPFHTARSFAKTQSMDTGPPVMVSQTGTVATFTVRVLFRQNASWQGSVIWQEGRVEQSFRSVLELIVLMDSAMRSQPVQCAI